MIVLTPDQEECVNSLVKNKVNILLGNVGSGKSIISITTASLYGAKNVLLFTKPSLPVFDQTNFSHKVKSITKLAYSKLRYNKRSKGDLERQIKKLLADIPKDIDYVIADECDQCKGYESSQQGRVFWEIIKVLNLPTLFMSATLRPTRNLDFLPLLAYKNSKSKNTNFDIEYSALKLMFIKEEYNPYSKYKPLITDHNKEKFIETFDANCYRIDTKHLHDIKKSDYFIELVPDKQTLALSKELFFEKAYILNKKFIITKNINTDRKFADGWVEIKNIITGKLVEIKVLKNLPKIEKCKEIINKHKKTIIMTAFTKSVEIIAENIDNPIVYHGGLSKKEREDALIRFENEDSTLVATLSSISTGFNLQFADCIIYYSLPFNYRDIIQSIGRIKRINTEHDVHYYWLGVTGLDAKENKGIYNKIIDTMNNYGFGC